MELINSLLQEKEHRLSSKKYRLNDYQPSRRMPGQHGSRLADPYAQDYQGNYVYPDDAADIKSHYFFRRISWDRLHLTRPPFVPDVSSVDDTKYFDEEEPVSDVDDATSQSSHTIGASDENLSNAGPGTAYVTQVDGPQVLHEAYMNPIEHDEADAKKVVDRADAVRLREKKRPRDKVLRDKEVGRKALELRKKGAFLGYTYRRPHLPFFDDDRGWERPLKRSRLPSFE